MFAQKIRTVWGSVRGFCASQGHWMALGVSLALLVSAAIWMASTEAPSPQIIDYDSEPAAQQPGTVDRLSDVTAPTPGPSLEPLPLPAYIWPGQGVLGMGYAPETPVYSATLGQWQTHPGVDLLMREGELVLSIADGVVLEAKIDDLMGGVVAVDHGNGLVSTYQSLLSALLVKAGDKVNQGDPLGGASASAKAEQNEGAHVHLEISRDGSGGDPLSLLPPLAGK